MLNRITLITMSFGHIAKRNEKSLFYKYCGLKRVCELFRLKYLQIVLTSLHQTG
jgi:hypothetical protein